ncbi:hypothetical protein SGO26_29435 (plasmid) [Cupriavidus metallidurans]|uniref:hypothetical protein n=1 Tax=Cupriavidus metallidurans TaxID=119219 RepID=UPI003D75C801
MRFPPSRRDPLAANAVQSIWQAANEAATGELTALRAEARPQASEAEAQRDQAPAAVVVVVVVVVVVPEEAADLATSCETCPSADAGWAWFASLPSKGVSTKINLINWPASAIG